MGVFIQMKELRLTQEEAILMMIDNKRLHRYIMYARFREKGFDMNKPIKKRFDWSTDEIVYSQN